MINKQAVGRETNNKSPGPLNFGYDSEIIDRNTGDDSENITSVNRSSSLIHDTDTEQSGSSINGDILARNATSINPALNFDYTKFVFDMIFCGLILLGLLVLLVLGCTVGIPYIPIISALSAKDISTCALLAVASVSTGVVGLALSCFFQPENKRLNKSADNFECSSLVHN
jgi:hypothetical protein